ncbi:hypothetical protein F5Y13DRAFT_204870 [Hypoxylon sp. FL1857]|nr:hypothetical protein F5Y13DRAFT_204870 [Hypoxylon sp. FL1857]
MQSIPFDLIFEISKCLVPKDQFELGLTCKEWHSTFYPCMLRCVLFDFPAESALIPLKHAIKTDNPSMLARICYLVKSSTRKWHCDKCVRDWNWFLGKEGCLLDTAMRTSTRCFEFLLDSIDDSCKEVISGVLGCAHGYETCTTPRELLERAVFSNDPEALNIILDRQHLFDLVGMPRTEYLDQTFMMEENMSARVAECLFDHGIKITANMLRRLSYTGREFDADLCRVLVNKGGLDVNKERERGAAFYDGGTALGEACSWINPIAIETLLELGANPNGVKLELGEEIDVYRPIDILVSCWESMSMVGHKWRKIPQVLHRCLKALIEHGASTSESPVAGHPVKVLLEGIWRLLCPCARVAAGVAKRRNVTFDRLLEALSTVDIGPFEKLCDLVVDANPEYSAMAEGLRGKERLIKLLSQQEDRRITFKWGPIDDKIFRGKRFSVNDSPYDSHKLEFRGRPRGYRDKNYPCVRWCFRDAPPLHDNNHIVPIMANLKCLPDGTGYEPEGDSDLPFTPFSGDYTELYAFYDSGRHWDWTGMVNGAPRPEFDTDSDDTE